MTATLALPTVLRAQIVREARAAFPRECCGLIEGWCDGAAMRAMALHPTRNLAAEPDRFEIDPSAHIRLLRALRGTGREIVGCYHSHPDGRTALSPRDRANGGEEDFVWLIVALDAASDIALAAAAFANKTGWRDLRLDAGELVPCK